MKRLGDEAIASAELLEGVAPCRGVLRGVLNSYLTHHFGSHFRLHSFLNH
jgi:hypothetical protein